MIERIVLWLEKHRVFNVLLVFAYSSFLLFAHSLFVDVSVALMNYFSLAVYEKLVAIIFESLALGAIGGVMNMVRKRNLKNQFGVFFGFTLIMLVAHFFVLTEMNIEFVHAIIYGALALLLFPLVGRFGGAVALALPIMLFDEWYQHVILFPHYTEYYEFNDIVLDLLGAGMFVSVLGWLGVKQRNNSITIFKRVEVIVLGGITLITVMLICTCVVAPYAVDSCSNTWLVLNKLPEMTDFWYVHPTIGSTFHILKPIEGFLAIFCICLVYLGMDFQKK